jgi:hypothetical protein
MNVVNQAIIPNMDLDSGHIYNNTFYITQDSKNVNVSVDESKNSIKLTANDLEAGFTSSDYLYKLFFISATGSAEVKMTQVYLEVELAAGLQHLANDKMVPGCYVSSVKIDLPSDHMDYTLHGNFAS